jgi:hypothetical protein
MSSGIQSPPVRDHSIREPQVDGFFRRTQLEACLKRFYISDASSLDCLLAQNEKRNTIFARSSNGGFWPRKVENALSFNGD